MSPRPEMYQWIKVGGILSFLPFVIVSGPLAGYLLADFLQQKFKLGNYIIFICLAVGLLASIIESVRIIKLAVKIEKNR